MGNSDNTFLVVATLGLFGLFGFLAFLASRPKPPPPLAPAPVGSIVIYEQTDRGFVVTEKPLNAPKPITSAGFKLVKLGSKRREVVPRFKPVKVGKDEWTLVREE